MTKTMSVMMMRAMMMNFMIMMMMRAMVTMIIMMMMSAMMTMVFMIMRLACKETRAPIASSPKTFKTAMISEVYFHQKNEACIEFSDNEQIYKVCSNKSGDVHYTPPSVLRFPQQ